VSDIILTVVILCGFAAVILVLVAIRYDLVGVLGELHNVREQLLKCNEHLKGIPHDLDVVNSGLHDITLAIDPEFYERKSGELEEKLRSLSKGIVPKQK
jgi:hypothetical protein